jgi:hypothetical protein
MEGACQALAVIDPDMDGDADPIGGESAARSRPAEAAPDSAGLTEADVPAPQGADHAHSEEEEPAVSEPTNPAVATPPAAPAQPDPPAATASPAPGSVTLTNDQFEAMLARIAGTTPAKAELVGAGAPAESAPAPAAVAEVAPAVPAVVESDEARNARLIQEGIAKARVDLIQDLAAQGYLPGRRGYVAGTVTESAPAPAGTYPKDWPTEGGEPKPAHKLTEAEWDKHVAQGMTMPAVLGNRA